MKVGFEENNNNNNNNKKKKKKTLEIVQVFSIPSPHAETPFYTSRIASSLLSYKQISNSLKKNKKKCR